MKSVTGNERFRVESRLPRAKSGRTLLACSPELTARRPAKQKFVWVEDPPNKTDIRLQVAAFVLGLSFNKASDISSLNNVRESYWLLSEQHASPQIFK